MTPQAFCTETGVSRETLDRLRRYANLLHKWQRTINLVGPETLPDLWRRHMLDSAQLLPLLPEGTRTVLDVGSGAGFPGLVLAALGIEDVHLVESDGRKCAFLREAAREIGVAVTIHNVRLERLTPWAVHAVTARAFAPLHKMLGLVKPFLQDVAAVGLFLKGGNVDLELTEARKQWTLCLDKIQSRTHPTGVVLRIKEMNGD
ncbi:MAG: 16S rRNA (guanine(527)-N(7))-methyltransferase RsmG [Alphaproteobacteria bacterium]|nr:16S rRNA (guanine(527)-N(7))-methyltransferase RsmG [Alphaproteobacteria bacterium]